MADAETKFVTIIAGKQRLVEPIVESAGVADGGKMVKTDPATGLLDPSVVPPSAGATDLSTHTGTLETPSAVIDGGLI